MRVSDWRGSGRPTATPVEIDGNPGVDLIGPPIRSGVPQNSRRFSPTEVPRNAGTEAPSNARTAPSGIASYSAAPDRHRNRGRRRVGSDYRRNASFGTSQIWLKRWSGGGGNRTRVRGRTGQSVYKRSLRFSLTRRTISQTTFRRASPPEMSRRGRVALPWCQARTLAPRSGSRAQPGVTSPYLAKS